MFYVASPLFSLSAYLPFRLSAFPPLFLSAYIPNRAAKLRFFFDLCKKKIKLFAYLRKK